LEPAFESTERVWDMTMAVNPDGLSDDAGRWKNDEENGSGGVVGIWLLERALWLEVRGLWHCKSGRKHSGNKAVYLNGGNTTSD